MIHLNQILSFYVADSNTLRVKLFGINGRETCVLCTEDISTRGWYEIPGRFSFNESEFARLRLLVMENNVFALMLMKNDINIIKRWRPYRVDIGQARTIGPITVRMPEVSGGLILLP